MNDDDRPRWDVIGRMTTGERIVFVAVCCALLLSRVAG